MAKHPTDALGAWGCAAPVEMAPIMVQNNNGKETCATHFDLNYMGTLSVQKTTFCI